MCGGVLLEEMVLAPVSGELELGADADDGAGGLGPGDGLLDVAEVGVEVHRPLVEVAGGHPQKPHLVAAQINRLERDGAALGSGEGERRIWREWPADGDLGRGRRRRRVGGGARPDPTVVRWSGTRMVVGMVAAASSGNEDQLVGEGH